MKKMQNRILSVLIFSFIFLVMHDFAMLKIDSHDYYNTPSTDVELVNISAESELDLADLIHKSIHTLLAIDTQNTPRIAEMLIQSKPIYTIIGMSSNNNHVLDRPPLS